MFRISRKSDGWELRSFAGPDRSPRRQFVSSYRAALTVLAIVVLASIGIDSPLAAESAIPRTARPEAATVYIISPADGETVTSPVTVRFGLNEMGVAPAGVDHGGTGHHHLVVDAELPPMGLPIPSSDQYRHFGKGQTEVELELEPGHHTLQLLLGDHIHVPHDPPVASEKVRITVVTKDPESGSEAEPGE